MAARWSVARWSVARWPGRILVVLPMAVLGPVTGTGLADVPVSVSGVGPAGLVGSVAGAGRAEAGW